MSHVTVVSDEERNEVMAAVNAYPQFNLPGGNFGFRLIDDCAGGYKALQVEVAAGAFNYLNFPELLAHLRAIDWARWDIGWVQIAAQDEHCHGGFGIMDVYREAASDKPQDMESLARGGA